ncbi:MAG: KUP/HAK/KT family potassium transporter [Thiohalocapsa sp.]|uniref:potassium transporter Kup n=1 Tax=Thiohalocapsa sp. TaxID=2497641 RepID=UPI0025DCEB6F|nr:KUP/HAK/KT family potassium transporter [Thiohalocapsa sp.]MCG6940880.1 KUP/HAK/KT family potassium transporter [Thiohalocapsa sp.]
MRSFSLRDSLLLTALGVVYGDIGTSPIYTMNIVFSPAGGLPVNGVNVLGILSLVFWSLFLVVSVKYMLFVLSADNDGDGGVIALATLLRRIGGQRARSLFLLLGVVASALLVGDGMLTPAISVLSAVQGLELLSPGFAPWVPELTVVVLLALFAIQHRGTATIGAVFGPVMLAWFLVLAVTGLLWALKAPLIFTALDPRYALLFFIDNGWAGFVILGTVFLVVTGSEALYADLGHFGRAPIRRTWLFLVWPALMLNYLGQGALLLAAPSHPGNSFFAMVPHNALPALILLATLATIIASQAIISGLFSLFRQLSELDYYPPIGVRHTSARHEGQIYIDSVNWLIMAGTIALVLLFQSSGGLANAYGLAIGGVTLITSLLFLAYLRRVRGRGWLALVLLGVLLLGVDLAFLTALLTKLFSGAQVILVISGALLLVMLTWRWGQERVHERNRLASPMLADFLCSEEVERAERVPGTAIFLSSTPSVVPRSLLHNFRHNQILHRETYLLRLRVEDVPRVPLKHKLTVESLGAGVFSALLRLGYMELPRHDNILTLLGHSAYPPSSEQPSLFLSRARIDLSSVRPAARWRARLYAFMQRNTPSPSLLLDAPPQQVIEIGVQHKL